MSILGTPRPKFPEPAFALQKYLLLHSQHEALQRHLDSLSSCASSPSSPSSTSSSPTTTSPSHPQGPPSHSSPRPNLIQRRSSLPTSLSSATLAVIEAEEQNLQDVNLQIKMTLTELLNCASVRCDSRYRMWVLTRLMDAERELKLCRSRGRGRRESVGGEVCV